jgi:hypothetical protein
VQDYDGDYEPNQYCSFTFNSVGSTTLERAEWGVEDHPSCGYDYLQVNGGIKYCGSTYHQFPPTMEVSGLTTFVWYADGGAQDMGFKICAPGNSTDAPTTAPTASSDVGDTSASRSSVPGNGDMEVVISLVYKTYAVTTTTTRFADNLQVFAEIGALWGLVAMVLAVIFREVKPAIRINGIERKQLVLRCLPRRWRKNATRAVKSESKAAWKKKYEEVRVAELEELPAHQDVPARAPPVEAHTVKALPAGGVAQQMFLSNRTAKSIV